MVLNFSFRTEIFCPLNLKSVKSRAYCTVNSNNAVEVILHTPVMYLLF